MNWPASPKACPSSQQAWCKHGWGTACAHAGSPGERAACGGSGGSGALPMLPRLLPTESRRVSCAPTTCARAKTLKFPETLLAGPRHSYLSCATPAARPPPASRPETLLAGTKPKVPSHLHQQHVHHLRAGPELYLLTHSH